VGRKNHKAVDCEGGGGGGGGGGVGWGLCWGGGGGTTKTKVGGGFFEPKLSFTTQSISGKQLPRVRETLLMKASAPETGKGGGGGGGVGVLTGT